MIVGRVLIDYNYRLPLHYMKTTFIISIFCLISISSFSQAITTETDESAQRAISFLDKTPMFIGGDKAMTKFVNTNAIYTKDAIDTKVSGRVYVKFWIATDGRVDSPVVWRGLHPDLDSIGLLIVKNMPNWIPGEVRDNKIRCSYMLPICFRFSGRGTLAQPVPSSYWASAGRTEFFDRCAKEYSMSELDTDCWYRFVIWNFNHLRMSDISLDELFRSHKCK